MGQQCCVQRRPEEEEIKKEQNVSVTTKVKSLQCGNKGEIKSDVENSFHVEKRKNSLKHDELDPKEILVDVSDDKKEKLALILQKYYHGKKYREEFNSKIKGELIQEGRNHILKSYQGLVGGEANDKFNTVSTKMNTFPEEKTIEEIQNETEGWKKYYDPTKEEETFFHPDFGKVFKDQVIVEKDDKTDDGEIQIYKGSVNMDNKKHGYGVLSTKDSVSYGTWVNGKFTGWNKKRFRNGAVLEGKFINGKITGKGKFSTIDGDDTYEGDFVDGKKEGKGIVKKKSAEYSGDFVDNKLEGKGKITFTSAGEEYEGTFENNNITGKGTVKWENGESYEGELLNGRFHGKGKYVHSDGQIYEGDYVNGVKQGHGKLIFAGGKKIYEGPFVNGVPHGIGKFTKGDKTVEAEFNEGKFVRKL